VLFSSILPSLYAQVHSTCSILKSVHMDIPLRVKQIDFHISPLLDQGTPGNGFHVLECSTVLSIINEAHDVVESHRPSIVAEAAEGVKLVLSELEARVSDLAIAKQVFLTRRLGSSWAFMFLTVSATSLAKSSSPFS